MRVEGKALGVALALVYIFLWASAYVPSKIGVIDSSPLWFLVVRFAAAALVLTLIAVTLRAQFPATARGWFAAFLLGILANAAYLGLTYEALRHLASGIGAIIASTNPLFLALVAPVVLREPLNVQKVVGMLLGFGGVVAIVLVRAGGGTAEPRDVALALAGVIVSVAGTIVYKRWCAGQNLLALTTVQLASASLVLLPLALIFEGAPHAIPEPRLAVSFVYLVLAISVGASLLWFWLLRHGDASRVSAYYFLTPVFGLAISAVILHESVAPRDLGGLLSIVAGIALVQRS